MFKAIALLTRRADLTREQFIEYYETRHAPLITSLLPPFREYRRNFLEHDDRLAGPDAPAADFDVVSEFVFDDRAGYEAMLAAYAVPDTARRIAADEENFVDRTRTRMYVVETRSTDTGA
ncbi:EthD domain-containing protein [Tomitella fengzijianii]|uniref:EthD family reductase n=1 Tax=Tomitella fengzijianii TaxID=2597660 RepID=A0A516X315_9ACTN|nr:EthD domain-containing protein [Tomitella fengzijianii]QDQ97454.1 EthD family reductase [Tomitella fengzijianii]